MKNILALAHVLVSSVLIALCLAAVAMSVRHIGAELPAVGLSRLTAGLLCGLLAVAHLIQFRSGRAPRNAALLFYPAFALVGLASAFVVSGTAKQWAPADAAEALAANIIGYSIVTVLGSLSWRLCVVGPGPNNSSKPTPLSGAA